MPLPYWSNARASTNYYEPVFQNQFEVILTPPAVISGSNVGLLVEHVTSLSGLPENNSNGATLATQAYKFATRSYAAAVPDKTTADLVLNFTVNLNEDNDAYIYNMLRAWNDIVYNPLTGKQGLKKDYVGSMSVHMSDKSGAVFREWKFPAIIPNSALTAIKLDYTTAEIYSVSMTYRADHWTETRTGEIKV